MSSAQSTAYWCHQCRRTVRLGPLPPGAELSCPICHEGFLEETESGDVQHPGLDVYAADLDGGPGRADSGADPGRMPGLGPFQGAGLRARAPQGGQPGFWQVLEAMSAVLQQIQPAGFDAGGPEGNPGAGPGVGAGDGDRARPVGHGVFNPMLLWQGPMQQLLGQGNVEIFFDNGAGGPPRRLPGNFGDYFLGPGLDQLIQQLAENDPNRYGAPPASKSAIDAMPTIQIQKEHVGTDAAQCAVCKEEFDLGCDVKQMPCKHMYHAECILPWLSQHNSCPVCRYEMPTDDPDYNQARAAQQQAMGPGTAPGGEGLAAGNTGFTFLSGHPSGFQGVTSDSSQSTGVAGGGPGVSTGTNSGGGATGAGAASGRRISFHLPWPFRTSPPSDGETASTSRGNGNTAASTGNSGGSGQTSVPEEHDDSFLSRARHEELD